MRSVTNLYDSFTIQLRNLEDFFPDSEGKKLIGQMISYIESSKVIASKISHKDKSGITTIGAFTNKFLEVFSKFSRYLLSSREKT